MYNNNESLPPKTRIMRCDNCNKQTEHKNLGRSFAVVHYQCIDCKRVTSKLVKMKRRVYASRTL